MFLLRGENLRLEDCNRRFSVASMRAPECVDKGSIDLGKPGLRHPIVEFRQDFQLARKGHCDFQQLGWLQFPELLEMIRSASNGSDQIGSQLPSCRIELGQAGGTR